MRHSLRLFFTVFLCSLSVPESVLAQGLERFIERYDKPAKLNHMTIEDSNTKSSKMNYYSADEGEQKATSDKASPKDLVPEEVTEKTKDVSKESKNTYIAKPKSDIDFPKAGDEEDEEEKEFSYKSSGVVLADDERFPELEGLNPWPWLRELTYGLEHAATQNALQIMDRDLSKVSPMAMIWAAQHYHDAGKSDKALFLYLGSRLRSSVDQSRFQRVKKVDLSASEENVEVERSSGTAGGKKKSSFGDLSSYKAIASSIGRPILRYGLKNPAAYKKQLKAAMLWDLETPYDYLPSVADLKLDDTNKEEWVENYHKIRTVYEKQMNKIIDVTSK